MLFGGLMRHADLGARARRFDGYFRALRAA